MSKVIDLDDVMERVQDDKELLLELFEIFSEDFVMKRKILGQALTNKDQDKAKEITHSLKGATGNISASQMHESCIALDRMSKEGDFESMQSLVLKLDDQFAAVQVRMAEIKIEFNG